MLRSSPNPRVQSPGGPGRGPNVQVSGPGPHLWTPGPGPRGPQVRIRPQTLQSGQERSLG